MTDVPFFEAPLVSAHAFQPVETRKPVPWVASLRDAVRAKGLYNSKDDATMVDMANGEILECATM